MASHALFVAALVALLAVASGTSVTTILNVPSYANYSQISTDNVYTFTNATLNVSLLNVTVASTSSNTTEDGWTYTNNGLWTQVAAIMPATTFTGIDSVLSLYDVSILSNPLWIDGTLTLGTGTQVVLSLAQTPTAAYTVGVVVYEQPASATSCVSPSAFTPNFCGSFACFLTAAPVHTGDYTECAWILNVATTQAITETRTYADGSQTITTPNLDLASFTSTYETYTLTIESSSQTQITSLYNGIMDFYNSQVYVLGSGANFGGAGHLLLQTASTMYLNSASMISDTFYITVESTSEIVISAVTSMVMTAAANGGLFVSGAISGNSILTSTTGSLYLLSGSTCRAPVEIGANTAASNSRSLLATTVTATTYACGAEFGSGTVNVVSGGVLSAKTSCTFGTIIDSNAASVTASSSTSTTTSTLTTVNSGSYLAFTDVASTSNLVNFNGDIVFVSGSTIQVTLTTMPSGLDRYTVDIARYLAATCDISTAAVTFTNCQGEFTCSVGVVSELAGTSCRIQVTVEDNDTSQESLYYLFLLLLIFPIIGVFAAIVMKKKAKKTPEFEPEAQPEAIYASAYPTPTPTQTPPMYAMPM